MALIRASRLWPRRDIPWVWTKAAEKDYGKEIKQAVGDWNRQTKINLMFLPDYAKKHGIPNAWIRFRVGSGRCSSGVGRPSSGYQDIDCNEGKSWKTLVHEIGHALGLYHEHQRMDRDNWVFVVEEQMGSGEYQGNYLKKRPPWALPHGGYDCNSVMHYPFQTTEKDGETFRYFDRLPWGCGAPMGWKKHVRNGIVSYLSDGDIAAINAYY